MSMNMEIRYEKVAYTSGFELIINCFETIGRSAADVSPAYAALPSVVPYTNRPFGHRRWNTKRLTIVVVVAVRQIDADRRSCV